MPHMPKYLKREWAFFLDERGRKKYNELYFNVNTTKTPASMRQVLMLGFVKEAFEQEKRFRTSL